MKEVANTTAFLVGTSIFAAFGLGIALVVVAQDATTTAVAAAGAHFDEALTRLMGVGDA